MLHRINWVFAAPRKSLILLRSPACRESVQDVGNQDAASLSARRTFLFHKVTHSGGGEFQKRQQIMDLDGLVEAVRKMFSAPFEVR